MGETTGASIFDRMLKRIREIGFSFLKVVYIIPFFVFGLWLISHVYISGFDLSPLSLVSSDKVDDSMFKMILQKKETIPRDHFHMTDSYIERQEPNPPICVACHGTYAHSKEKKVRAVYNMHAGFISCSVCHVRKDGSDTEVRAITENETIEFLWVDRESGEFANAVEGEYGKYPAMIYPIRFNEQGGRRLFTPIKAEAAQEFLGMWPELTPDQVAEAKAKLHEPISKEPVSCSDCHKKEGYLDFTKLGFPERRVDHLISSEVAGMVENDQTFYLPSVVDFTGK